MADWLITDIDDAVWERFVALAERRGKSPEELMHDLIVDYAADWDSAPENPSTAGC